MVPKSWNVGYKKSTASNYKKTYNGKQNDNKSGQKEDKGTQNGDSKNSVACTSIVPNIGDRDNLFEMIPMISSFPTNGESDSVSQSCQTDPVFEKCDEEIPIGFRPFASDGLIGPANGVAETPVRMIRDTGADQTIVVRKLVEPCAIG